MAAPGDPLPDSSPPRPASLWGESGRSAPPGFVATRFDTAASVAPATFDVCHPALALRALLLVQAVLAVAVLALADTVAGWGRAQAAAAFGGTLATLLWLVPLCAARRPLDGAGAQLRVLVVLLLGAAAALGGWLPLWALDIAGGAANGLRLAGIAAAGAGIAALLWTWLGLRARIWQPADASARLAELQSRIQPHFLFNALNTALALVRSDPARAESVLEDLAELFRAVLADTGASSVSLDEEIALAKAYLAIEQARFGSRMAVDWDIAPGVGAARVPPLVLQPLVENAVRHGVEPAVGGGRVWVRAGTRRGNALLTVSNTVGDARANPGHGIALDNVRERLRLLHDVAAQCETWREDGVFHARIVLPLP